MYVPINYDVRVNSERSTSVLGLLVGRRQSLPLRAMRRSFHSRKIRVNTVLPLPSGGGAETHWKGKPEYVVEYNFELAADRQAEQSVGDARFIPELKAKLDGYALRVPTPNVRVVNLTVMTEKLATVETVNARSRQSGRRSDEGHPRAQWRGTRLSGLPREFEFFDRRCSTYARRRNELRQGRGLLRQ